MERDFRNKWIAVLLVLAVLALGLAGCGTKETGEARTKTCFIYTDGLLDDLCAIEYLAGRYDSAVILLQDPDGLAGNDYGSAAVTDKDALLRAASGWFASVTEYADGVDLSGADLYLLGPLTVDHGGGRLFLPQFHHHSHLLGHILHPAFLYVIGNDRDESADKEQGAEDQGHPVNHVVPVDHQHISYCYGAYGAQQ